MITIDKLPQILHPRKFDHYINKNGFHYRNIMLLCHTLLSQNITAKEGGCFHSALCKHINEKFSGRKKCVKELPVLISMDIETPRGYHKCSFI